MSDDPDDKKTTRRPARPRRTPVEYIVVVGGPSNTFNGYYFYDPAKDEDVAQAHPKNLAGIAEYIGGSPGKPVPSTHDLYWANFVEPAVRLFGDGIATPSPGDIVSVLVYLPAYVARDAVDWQASPWNGLLHRDSPWVRGKDPYDPTVRLHDQGKVAPPQPKTPISNKKDKPKPKPKGADPEHVLDHDILMRTTSPNEIAKGVIKRPQRGEHYLDLIHDIPRKIVFGPKLGGTPRLPQVLVKLLLLRTPDELFAYLSKGDWSGEHWRHILDKHDEDDMGGPPLSDCGFDFAATRPPSWAEAEWQKLPKVDRKTVKIKRFDYFGHSDGEGFYLKYGLTNDKGEVPQSEVTVDNPEWKSKLKRDVLTHDAVAQLWGCFQGSGTAEVFAKTFKEVVACADAVLYTNVIEGMPKPDSGSSWTTFPLSG